MSLVDIIRLSRDRLAAQPGAFGWLRRLPERNYRATKKRIAAVRDGLGAVRVLDCGCGTGEYAALFEPERYLGVDVDAGYVRFAQRRHPRHRFEVADLRTWPVEPASFGLVLVNGVLHHLDDTAARALLATALRALAPGGTLVVIEDVSLPGAGWITRLVHKLDLGDHIRDTAGWDGLVSEFLPIVHSETYQSGWCPYHLMLCRAA